MTGEAAPASIAGPTVKVVRGGDTRVGKQGSAYRPGVSDETAGSTNIWLGMIVLPAGRRTSAHSHQRHETALLMTAGEEIEIWSGARLERHDRVRPGDYLFIPAGVPHVAVNPSAADALFLGARNDPRANEGVVLMPELDAAVP